MDLFDLYQHVKRRFRESDVEDADLAARFLIRETCGISDSAFLIGGGAAVDNDLRARLESYAQRHIDGEPISRILNRAAFWDLSFRVTPDVLDPRPETEMIITRALKIMPRDSDIDIADLGTGSGCLIVTLMTLYSRARGWAVDKSPVALAVARDNAVAHGVEDRISFIEGNWLESPDRLFDLIVSNPPYIPNRDIANLDVSVKNYDPILALDGGKDGFDAYRQIIPAIKKHLKQDGTALLEIGIFQAEKIERLVEDSGLCVKSVHVDMSGIPRVVEISFGEK